MSIRKPVKGTVFLFLGSFIGLALGFAYWIIIARISSPDIVGHASAAFTLVTLIYSASNLGVAQGVQRFLGRSFGSGNIQEFKRYLLSGVLLLALSTIAALFTIFLFSELMKSAFSLSNILLLIILLTVLCANMNLPIQLALVSLLSTNYVAVGIVTGALAKIAVGVLLVLYGFGVDGVVFGLMAAYLVSFTVHLFFLRRVLIRQTADRMEMASNPYHFTEVFKSGMPTYIPGVIRIAGTSTGILVLFGVAGSVATGLYYMAFQIFALVVILPSSIIGVLYPYASGRPDQDHVIMKQGIKFSLMFCFPVMFSLLLYPSVPLSIIGAEYIAAIQLSQVLFIAIPLYTVENAVSSLAYARGLYRTVLCIGLASNVSRVLLYFTLTPTLAGLGASLAYLGGSLIGVAFTMIFTIKMQFSIGLKTVFKIAIAPAIIAAFNWLSSISWYIGIPILIGLSVIVYMRTGILSFPEIEAILESTLPKQVYDKIAPNLYSLIRRVYGE
jgi:O-antigen/teichoic acid export membrane protein